MFETFFTPLDLDTQFPLQKKTDPPGPINGNQLLQYDFD